VNGVAWGVPEVTPRDAATPITSAEADQLFEPLLAYDRLLLAVSGGADSMALLHLAADWAERRHRAHDAVLVVTVDHGRRPEAAAEAQAVARSAKARGLLHETKTIVQPTANPNATPTPVFTQSWGRDQRYRLLTERALEALPPQHKAAILTGHHQDDQAETMLMRLARGSGVQGLSAMRATRNLRLDQLDLVRPLLSVPKSRLQATLIDRHITWIEDPSNLDQRFERPALRAQLAARLQLGLTTERLARASQRLARASSALDAITDRVMLHSGAAALDRFGAFTIHWPTFLEHPSEIRLRILARMITALRGDATPVSLGQLEALTEGRNWASLAGQTLHHCAFLASENNSLIIIQELGRAQHSPPLPRPGAPHRWGPFWVTLTSQPEPGAIICPLGKDGLASLGPTGHPVSSKRVLATLPALKTATGAILSVPTLGLAPAEMTVSSAVDQACRPIQPTPMYRK
jgi:tRNA(Ile)-lysidine synthase